MGHYQDVFTREKLAELFPPDRTEQFFEALFGDAEEGSYDIELGYSGGCDTKLHFELRLLQRPGKCLACNLTYGLPQVFSRHPVINVPGIAEAVARTVGNGTATWKLGSTREVSATVHVIPLLIEVA
jgi:hypothetical protein